MDNAGVQILGVVTIGTAQTGLLIPSGGPANLAGMTALTVDAEFKYGSGPGSVTAIVVTAFGENAPWRHIARFDFGTSSRVAKCNLEGLLSMGVSDYADLTAEGFNDGYLGDRIALLLITTGNYTNTTLAVRASVR